MFQSNVFTSSTGWVSKLTVVIVLSTANHISSTQLNWHVIVITKWYGPGLWFQTFCFKF